MPDGTAQREAALRIDVVSLFPETVRAALAASIPARAVERALADKAQGYGANEISLLVSATDTHSQKNLARSRQEQWTPCLGLIPGEVRRFDLVGKKQADGSAYKVPHMGWNQVRQDGKHPLWEGIPDLSSFYFVHSYYVVPQRKEDTAGSTEYGDWFTSAVARGNIFATQFHPEKSAEYGLKLYKNFVSWHP